MVFMNSASLELQSKFDEKHLLAALLTSDQMIHGKILRKRLLALMKHTIEVLATPQDAASSRSFSSSTLECLKFLDTHFPLASSK